LHRVSSIFPAARIVELPVRKCRPRQRIIVLFDDYSFDLSNWKLGILDGPSRLRAHPERSESFLLGCCETPEHEADHCEADKSDDGARVALEVASQTPIAANPCQGSFDNPALWNNSEVVQLGSLDDFDDPTAGACGNVRHSWSAISRVGEDALYEWKQGSCALGQDERGAIAILDIGRVNRDA
jgi:hypothetical protein